MSHIEAETIEAVKALEKYDAGFETDIAVLTEDELAVVARFAALYRELRPITHGGVVTHPELRDAAWRATQFTTADAEASVVVVATVRSLEDARPERLRLSALDPDRREVQSRDPPPARGQPHRVASLARADIERATGSQ